MIVIVIINLVLLWVAVYKLNSKLLQGSTVLLYYTSTLVMLTLVSFLYYLSLVFKLQFSLLIVLISAINLSHLYFTASTFKSFYVNLPKGKSNYDSVPFLVLFIIAFFFLLTGSKYGFFDGWALWNSHARFLIHPDSWQNMFADTTYESSADYPLMLPALIAFFWRMIGSTTFMVPLLISFTALATIALLLYHALKPALAIALLLTDRVFMGFVSEQCADIPLSVFILMTFVLYNHLTKTKEQATTYLLGFICASCMWIKNEGLLFCATFSAGFMIVNYKRPGLISRYIAGALLPIIVTLSYKQLYAPDTAFFSSGNNTQAILTKLQDGSRYMLIAEKYAAILLERFWIALIVILAVGAINRQYFKSVYFITLLLMLGGYTFVYLISPYHLGWHIYTSFHRLMNQIYPSLIFTTLLFCGRKLNAIH